MMFIDMKATKMKYLLLLFVVLGFAGCRDVTVGYLRTTYAKYGVDTLHLNVESIKVKIAELEEKYDGGYGDMALLGTALRTVNEIGPNLDNLKSERRKLNIELKGLDPDEDAERVKEIYARLDEIEADLGDYEEAQYNIEEGVAGFLIMDFGLTENEANSVCAQYISYFSTVEKKFPWTTATIEGVLGTEPIHYSIAGVTSEDGDAGIFQSELVMYGGGRMELPFEVKAPKGMYHVSILIENEGYSSIVENAFTFIVD